ncbi:MAG: UDP-N-acetylmuramoyl-tripeptide--D-alanyl-D-alanine ligase [Candidatus Omnitrophica bacterium]|nr:UDP-N-acetylmuramoyl-tripeptide--D-alanyl-D-alanine ligase [Candidatus Omnitrophota bacterium]
MMWTIEELLEATHGRLLRGDRARQVSGISIDSRRIAAGEAFVAIKGLRFDGHAFVEAAAHRGASCVIVSRELIPTNGSAALPAILVGDTTKALGDLARFHRQRVNPLVIAVTGSCGKTTTKELIAHVVGASEEVLKTFGTQNNHIGVPLTLLRLTPAHRYAVVEVGSNHPGEIAYLASMVQPDAAVVTNVGPVHLEFLGSLEGVRQEKLSLLRALPPDGSAVLPGDQMDIGFEAPKYLHAMVRRVFFGTTDRCDIQAFDVQRADAGMLLRLRDQFTQWTIPLIGFHNVENTLAAIACAWAVGVPLSLIRDRLMTAAPIPLRSEVLRCNGLTILNDCYNANPLSMARALETLRDLQASRKVAVVGDMLELGDYAPSAHQAIGRLAIQLGIDAVIAVGQHAESVAEGVRESRPEAAATYQTVEELLTQLPGLLQQGDGLLVKGSRRLQLEQVTDFLLKRYARQPDRATA